MTNTNRRRLYWLGAIVICAAIVPPVIFGAAPQRSDRKGGDPWRNTIEDFQTLITGFFAIGAAYVTVRQMEKSDKKSDNRHVQLVRLSLRADALRVERLLYPQVDELLGLQNHLRLINAGYTGEKSTSEYVKFHREEIKTVIRKIIAVLDRPQWTTGQDLFDGTLTYQAAELRRWAERTSTAFSHIESDMSLLDRQRTKIEKPELVEQKIDSNLANVFSLLSRLEETMRNVFEGLTELGAFYDIRR